MFTNVHSLLDLPNFVRFLPFPETYPSSSAKGSRLEGGREPKEVLAICEKGGDDQLYMGEARIAPGSYTERGCGEETGT